MRRVDTVTLDWSRLAFLYMSSVLGAGILIVPGHTVDAAGGAAILVWLVLGGVCVAIASLFAAISTSFPRASGIREIIHQGLNSSSSTYATWLLIAVYVVGNPAMGITSAQYLAVVLDAPELSSPVGSAVFGMGFLLISLIVSAMPSSVIGSLQAWSMRAVFVVIVVAVVVAVPHLSWRNVTARGPADFSGISAAAGIAFYAYLGWENVSLLASRVDDPARAFRRAIRWAVPVVVLVYLVAVIVYATSPIGGSPLLVPALTGDLPSAVRVPLLLTSLLALVAATNAWVLGGTSLVADTIVRVSARPAAGRRLGVVSRGCLLIAYAAVLTGTATGAVSIDLLLVWTSCLFLSVYGLAACAFMRVRRSVSLSATTVLAAAVFILLSSGPAGAVLAVSTVSVAIVGRLRNVRSARPSHHDRRRCRPR